MSMCSALIVEICELCEKEGVRGVTLYSTEALPSEFQIHSPRRTPSLSLVIYNSAGGVLFEGDVEEACSVSEPEQYLTFLEIIPSVIPMTEDDVLVDGNSGRPICVTDGKILETEPGTRTAVLWYTKPGDRRQNDALSKRTPSHRNHVPRGAPRRLLCAQCRNLYRSV